MKIEVWWIGKTNEKYLTQGIDLYLKRIKHYNRINTVTFPDVKSNKIEHILKSMEGQLFMSKLGPSDYVILCDEKGKEYDSIKFSAKLEWWLMNSQYKRIIFIVAGAFGASDELKSRADTTLSLSRLTFSHQMVRLFLMEQIYRAFTIIRNEKYHNV